MKIPLVSVYQITSKSTKKLHKLYYSFFVVYGMFIGFYLPDI